MSGLKFGEDSKVEATTAELDTVAMKYLSWVLYPLCIGGAIYSLLYTPHKSWYSWTIQTAVNGVYAFGFLFMLPQLFLNYKLKSVAHLPWRAFMYKAFNTFIGERIPSWELHKIAIKPMFPFRWSLRIYHHNAHCSQSRLLQRWRCVLNLSLSEVSLPCWPQQSWHQVCKY